MAVNNINYCAYKNSNPPPIKKKPRLKAPMIEYVIVKGVAGVFFYY